MSTSNSTLSPVEAIDLQSPQAQLTSLWSQVQQDPNNFEKWSSLVSLSESLGLIDHIRASIRGLLTQFPLMFGYWQRLSRFERSSTAALDLQTKTNGKLKDNEIQSQLRSESRKIIEEGIQAIPHSHELWSLLGAEMIEAYKVGDQTIDQVRSVFQRGSKVIHSDYNSSAFYQLWIDFEIEQYKSPESDEILIGSPIAFAFSEILKLNIRELDHFHSIYQNYVENHTLLNDLLTPIEASALVKARHLADDLSIWTQSTLTSIKASRESTYFSARRNLSNRASYEQKLQRHYFHVQPVEKMEQNAWMEYIQWMILQTNSVKKLSKNSDQQVEFKQIENYSNLTEIYSHPCLPDSYIYWIGETIKLMERALIVNCASADGIFG